MKKLLLKYHKLSLGLSRSMNALESRKIGLLGYAPHKTASMFIFKLFRDLAQEKGMAFYSSNNRPPNHENLSEDIDQAFCVAPMRSLQIPSGTYPNIEEIKKVVQIRDPRDILTSEYFSFAFSHPTKDWTEKKRSAREKVAGMSVDDYVLRVAEGDTDFQLSRFPIQERLLTSLEDLVATGAIVVKYEDMVTRYEHWLGQVIRAFEFGALENKIRKYYYVKYRDEFEVPAQQDPSSHKRAIKPGDYLNKLSPETISGLNDIFKPFLEKYGYPF